MTDFLTRRGATWHFVRRVPAEFAALDQRGIVRHSTRIKIADERQFNSHCLLSLPVGMRHSLIIVRR